ncbi:MBL fold metallo-hydrolase [Halobium salinum]|uniref:MBL fold metallo-hydrolase n=1 Tax=Halobium salinum TaxID=1364940 RepID=A0ABD5P983_9EURY|nr:MBL fold metallo-hydrolase [Halobium salinum]
MQVTDGVHVLPLEYDFDDRAMTIHPTVVETDRGLLLVDAGLPGARDRVEAHLDDAGFDLADVDLVLFTHQDSDHVDGFHDLVADAEGFDPLVVAHAAEAPAIDGREEPISKGGGGGERYEPVPVDLELVGDESVRTRAGPMRVVNTPGHTPGHVSLFFPDRDLLLAGDALTAEDGRLDAPVPHFTPDWEEARTSVRKLANFEIDRIVCYHGGVVDADAAEVRRVHEEMGAE